MSQHSQLTMDKKYLPQVLPGLEPDHESVSPPLSYPPPQLTINIMIIIITIISYLHKRQGDYVESQRERERVLAVLLISQY